MGALHRTQRQEENPHPNPSPEGEGLDRAALLLHARDSIARGSKSFALASKLFDAATRERAWLLYAWCRACDDLADGQALGHGQTRVTDPQARLATIRELTERALAGEATGHPAFDSLGLVAAECAIPPGLPRDLVAGFALDAAGWRPRHEDDLYRYCYHVAGAVGVMMAIVMGVPASDEETLDRACDLGIAFQLANIARDLCEDDRAGRCYLPVDWLVEIDVPPGEHMKPHYRPRIAMLARRLADRAAAYEASARAGTRALPFRSAWAVLAAAGIYGGIARKVAWRGPRAWDRRVVTSKAAKLGWVARGRAGGAARTTSGDAAGGALDETARSALTRQARRSLDRAEPIWYIVAMEARLRLVPDIGAAAIPAVAERAMHPRRGVRFVKFRAATRT